MTPEWQPPGKREHGRPKDTWRRMAKPGLVGGAGGRGGGGEATHANGEEVSRMKELCQYPMRHLLQKGAILMTDDDNDEALRDVNDASVRSKIRLK